MRNDGCACTHVIILEEFEISHRQKKLGKCVYKYRQEWMGKKKERKRKKERGLYWVHV